MLLWVWLFTFSTWSRLQVPAWPGYDQLCQRARQNLPLGSACPRKLLTASTIAPALVPRLLPYRQWDSQDRDYFRIHYHDPRLRFRPSLIVVHYTVSSSAEGTRQGFIRGSSMWDGDQGTVFGHPSVQLMVAQDGTVLQLLPLDRRATGSYGVDHLACSIEIVAMSERDLLSRPNQVLASFRLVRWLIQRYQIPIEKVYGHIDLSVGRVWVPEYLDYSDSIYPYCYPLKSARFDPGINYLRWLYQWLKIKSRPPR